MKTITIIALVSPIGLLTACGGSSSSTEPVLVDPMVASQGQNTAGLTATYNSTADTVTVSNGAGALLYTRREDYDSGTLRGYERDATDWDDFAFLGETSTGSGTVAMINATDDGLEAATITLSRVGTTQLPTSGTANYTGDYAAWLFATVGADSVGRDFVTGDATLTANFDDMNISGTITNRESEFLGAYENITLQVSSISDGTVTGTATGGQRPGGTTTDGDYTGLLTGTDAAEVVGSLIIEHTDPLVRTEVGGFVAE